MATRALPSLPVAALIILGLAVRLYHLDFQSLWRDEVDVLLFSTRDLDELVRNFLKQGENGPLYYVLYHYWLAAFGDSEIALRLPSALFGTAAIPVIYGLGRQLLDSASARFAALLATLSPYYVWYSQDAKMYPLLVLLTTLSFYLYLHALRTDNKAAWIGYVAVTTLGLYVHFFAALVILTQIALFLLFFRNRHRLSWFVSMGLLTLPYLPLAVWQIPTLLSPPATAYPSFSPSGIATVLLVLFVRGLGPTIPVLPLVLAVFLLMAAAALYGKNERRMADAGLRLASLRRIAMGFQHRGISILTVWLLVPLAAFLLISMRLPLFTDRYLIIVTPAFYLLVAAGFTGLRRHWRAAFWVAMALWLGIGLHSLVWQAHTKLKSDFRSAAASFADLAGPDDLVIFNMPYVRHTFQYYYRGQIHWMSAPYTNDGRAAERVDRLIRSEVGENSVVWLVSSEEHLWDARGLVRRWLRTNLAPAEVWDHPGVRIERYVPLSLYLNYQHVEPPRLHPDGPE